jgi:hypothetical protein
MAVRTAAAPASHAAKYGVMNAMFPSLLAATIAAIVAKAAGQTTRNRFAHQSRPSKRSRYASDSTLACFASSLLLSVTDSPPPPTSLHLTCSPSSRQELPESDRGYILAVDGATGRGAEPLTSPSRKPPAPNSNPIDNPGKPPQTHARPFRRRSPHPPSSQPREIRRSGIPRSSKFYTTINGASCGIDFRAVSTTRHAAAAASSATTIEIASKPLRTPSRARC